jgi:hypothetical protein
MKLFCSQCGQPLAVEEGDASWEILCPACGAKTVLPASTPSDTRLLPPESERVLWEQRRRRTTMLVALCILGLLAILIWLLLQPSSVGSPGRAVQNAIFGRRVTEAVEQTRQSGQQGNGTSQGQGQGQSGMQTGGQAGSQNQGQGEGSGQNNGERGQGQQRNQGAASDLPANPQLPDQAAGPAAPPERSIGWLDRFFGTQQRDGPIQAGEGGTGVGQPGAGNTNTVTARTTNEPIAAENTQAQPVPALPLSDLPTPPPRNTNRAAPPVNATLNDNMEQLLQQHRAGSGDVRISLMWNNRNDLDLHVVDPRGEELSYQHPASQSGGLLDIDMNAAPPLRSPAVENVFWPDRGAPPGVYRVYVNHYRKHDRADETAFTVRILVRGRTADFTGSIRFGTAKKLVHQFTLSAGN